MSINKLEKTRCSHNVEMWTKELDKKLGELVIENTFDFKEISKGMQENSRGEDSNLFTIEECQQHWTYLHISRTQKKGNNSKGDSDYIKRSPKRPLIQNYMGGEVNVENIENVENVKNVENVEREVVRDKLGNSAVRGTIEELKTESVEGNPILRDQSLEPDDHHDYDDEDNHIQEIDLRGHIQHQITDNSTIDVFGDQIHPSGFNIFKDSLRQTIDQIIEISQQVIPELEITPHEGDPEEQKEDDFVLLDYRYKRLENGEYVIQAKPLDKLSEIEREDEGISNPFLDDDPDVKCFQPNSLRKQYETFDQQLKSQKYSQVQTELEELEASRNLQLGLGDETEGGIEELIRKKGGNPDEVFNMFKDKNISKRKKKKRNKEEISESKIESVEISEEKKDLLGYDFGKIRDGVGGMLSDILELSKSDIGKKSRYNVEVSDEINGKNERVELGIEERAENNKSEDDYILMDNGKNSEYEDYWKIDNNNNNSKERELDDWLKHRLEEDEHNRQTLAKEREQEELQRLEIERKEMDELRLISQTMRGENKQRTQQKLKLLKEKELLRDALLYQEEMKNRDDIKLNLTVNIQKAILDTNVNSNFECYFDKSISYMDELPHLLPEAVLSRMEGDPELATLDRYKVLIIPMIDKQTITSTILPLFLHNSSFTYLPTREELSTKDSPFPLISAQYTHLKYPFNHPLLSGISADYSTSHQFPVLALCLDTSASTSTNTEEELDLSYYLKQIKLKELMDESKLDRFIVEWNTRFNDVVGKERDILCNLAYNKAEANKINQHLLQNKIVNTECCLLDLVYEVKYCIVNEDGLTTAKAPWELFKMNPLFSAYPNNIQTQTKHPKQLAILVFKQYSLHTQDIIGNNQDSLVYLLNECYKEGLYLAGYRLLYLTDSLLLKYNSQFSETLDANADTGLLALVFDGHKTLATLGRIVGPSDPQLAKRTDPQSIRANYGINRMLNCIIFPTSTKRNFQEICFWFSARVFQVQNTQDTQESSIRIGENNRYCLYPKDAEKECLILSVLITPNMLSFVIDSLNSLGIQIKYIRYINYSKEHMKFSHPLIIEDKGLNKGIILSQNNGFIIIIESPNLGEYMQEVIRQLTQKFISRYKIYIEREELIYHLRDWESSKEMNLNLFFPERSNVVKEVVYRSEEHININIHLDEKDNNLIDDIRKPIIEKANEKLGEYKDVPQIFFIIVKFNSINSQLLAGKILQLLSSQGIELLSTYVLGKDTEKYLNSSDYDGIMQVFKLQKKTFSYDQKFLPRSFKFRSPGLLIAYRCRQPVALLRTLFNLETQQILPGVLEDNKESLDRLDRNNLLIITAQRVVDWLLVVVDRLKLLLLDDVTCSTSLYSMYAYPYNTIMPADIQLKMSNPKWVRLYNSRIIELAKVNLQQVALCILKPPTFHIKNLMNRVLKTLIENYSQIGDIKMKILTEMEAELIYDHEIKYEYEALNTEIERLGAEEAHNEYVQHLTSGPCLLLQIKRIDCLYTLQDTLGLIPNKPSNNKNIQTFKELYETSPIQTLFYSSLNYQFADEENDLLFPIAHNTDPISIERSKTLQNISPDPQFSTVEVVFVLFAPKIVLNHDYVYIIEDILRSKFTICNIRKQKLKYSDLQHIFTNTGHDLLSLENELTKTECILSIFQKEHGIKKMNDLIGNFRIKKVEDFLGSKYKTKMKSLFEHSTALIKDEYGPNVFAFWGKDKNEQLILEYFDQIYNSSQFKLV